MKKYLLMPVLFTLGCPFLFSGAAEAGGKLFYPYHVSVGYDHVCALDEQGVKCWGSNRYGQIQVPILKNPRQVSAGNNHTCALDDEGVKCWGNNSHGQNHVPTLIFLKKDVSRMLKVLEKHSPAIRARYYSEMGRFNEHAFDDSQLNLGEYFLALLVGPAIESSDSEFIESVAKPAYKDILQKFEADLAKGHLQVKDSSLHRTIALKNMQVALGVSLELVPSADKIRLQSLVRVIGVAFQNPNDENVRSVLNELAAQRVILDSLKQSKKIEFLVSTLDLARSWLAKWVP